MYKFYRNYRRTKRDFSVHLHILAHLGNLLAVARGRGSREPRRGHATLTRRRSQTRDSRPAGLSTSGSRQCPTVPLSLFISLTQLSHSQLAHAAHSHTHTPAHTRRSAHTYDISMPGSMLLVHVLRTQYCRAWITAFAGVAQIPRARAHTVDRSALREYIH